MDKTKEEIGIFNQVSVSIPDLKRRICEQYGHCYCKYQTKIYETGCYLMCSYCNSIVMDKNG